LHLCIIFTTSQVKPDVYGQFTSLSRSLEGARTSTYRYHPHNNDNDNDNDNDDLGDHVMNTLGGEVVFLHQWKLGLMVGSGPGT